MDNKTALHTAARRFCQERFSEWADAYSELQAKENYKIENLFEPGWDYSPEAYRIFPRYRIDAAIQTEVERLSSNSTRNVDELRRLLIRAGKVAEDRLRAEFTNDLALTAIREEAADFKDYIQVLGESSLADITPLPYRRVLGEDESKDLWNRLKQTWGIGDGYWFPLCEGALPHNVIAFHADYWTKMNGGQVLRGALKDRGATLIFQLNEFKSSDPEYEMEISLLEPRYAFGGEQYTTSAPFDWLAYASHESSITIAGEWLTDIFKERWPDWSQRSYKGPYSTDDMAGTWETPK
jgi:hypothetical protein